MTIEKLVETNYEIWSLEMNSYLLREGLWRLTTGVESVLKEPDTRDIDYKELYKAWDAQQLRIERAIGILRGAMTHPMAKNYVGTIWNTPKRIWDDVQ